MQTRYTLGSLLLLLSGPLLAQPTFTVHNEVLGMPTHSGNCMAVADMNGDGRDDLPVLDQSVDYLVLYQNVDGTFTPYDYGVISGEQQWGMAVADIDNNGHKDFFSGGYYDGVHYTRITAPGQSGGSFLVPGGSIFAQNVSLGDMNNDGWLDGFACHDNGAPQTYLNDLTGNLSQSSTMDFTSNPPSDMSGNYGSVFTDFDNDGDIDLYIAKCRQGVNDPNDPRRWDRLFVNDGSGHYTDQAAAFGVENRWQTWAVGFGDWDNDGDLDLVAVDHDRDMQFFENDGTGHYTEIDDNGLDIVGFLLEVHMEDFDNDGFLDVLIGGGSQFYLQGHGDGTFTNVGNVFPSSTMMHSFAIGDLNSDGFMDVWASYGSGYTAPGAQADELWLNNTNANHWLNVKLQGVQSNRDAVGARVTLTTALGTQIREVRSGESYGLTNSLMCHFGLAENTTVQSMVIHWPSGHVDTYTNITADQNITVIEGTCIAPVVTVTSNAGFSICPNGPALTLTASAPGSTFHWSTNVNTSAISVNTIGYYDVTATSAAGCTAHNSVFIDANGGAPPTITADGPLAICAQDAVTITSTPAASYHWSNGATTQSITVSEPGDYSVVVVDGCPDLGSDTLSITALPGPLAPVGNDVTIAVPGTAQLTAVGDSIDWYGSATGGVLLGSGSPWTTPSVSVNTSFWCEVPGASAVVESAGGLAHPTSIFTENSNGFYPLFTATQHFTLLSVKVEAVGAGPRTIAMSAWPSGTVILQNTFNLPAGESVVDLNFDVPVGSYALRVLDNVPNLSYETISSGYPFPLGSAGEITSTNAGDQWYELFYDWHISAVEQGCASPRTEVEVFVGPTGIAENGVADLAVYPVPTSGMLNIVPSNLHGNIVADIIDLTGRTVLSRKLNNGNTAQQMDVSALAAGEYTLRLQHAGGVVVKRIVVR